jgi:hypothetical protein
MELPWKNPELIRHVRRELRPARMAGAAGIAVLICVLMLMVMVQMERDAEHHIRWNATWLDFYTFVVVVQGILLSAWCAATGAQAISSERQLKTIDFLRTTRLSSSDLAIGIVLGRPAMAYFIYVCVLPFTLVSGFLSGYNWKTVLGTQAVILIATLTLSLAGTLFSMLTEKPRSGEFLVLVFAFYWVCYLLGSGWQSTGNFSLYSALQVIPALGQLHGEWVFGFNPTCLFGRERPSYMVSAGLYLTFCFWLWLAVVRNVKRDREEIRLFSRWQAVALSVYISSLFLMQINLGLASYIARVYEFGERQAAQRLILGAAAVFVWLNFLVFYLMGIAILPPAGARKHWWREQSTKVSSVWSENAPPILWMISAAVLSWGAFGIAAGGYSRHFTRLEDWNLRNMALQMLVIVVYAMRDVLFLQWCSSTHIKSPMAKGTLLVALYYFSAGVLVATAQAIMGKPQSMKAYALLTPIGALTQQELTASLLGAGLQVGVIVLLLLITRARYVHRSMAPAAA